MKNSLWLPCLLIAFLLTAPWATAQNQIPERLLLTTGQYSGTGARALGMAGTYTGIADDYSSIWWNPAGLAQVKRIELQGSLSRNGFSDNTNYFGMSRSGSTSALRLNNIGMVFPLPVYQGALTFAVGYSQVGTFDRRTRITTPAIGRHYWDDLDELQNGHLGLWSLAGAMDVSQNLALGLGLNYWSGAVEYTRTGHYMDGSTAFYNEKTISTDLSAWGANIGALARLGQYARIGLMFQTPTVTAFNLDWSTVEDNLSTDTRTESSYPFDYKMTSPAVIRLGASVAPGRWLVAADLEYRDWTSLEFRDLTPYLDTSNNDVTRAEANQEIKDTYQSTMRISVGGEYLFPAYGLRLRAGYAREQPPFAADKGRDVIGLGIGALIDRSVMFDAGFSFTKYKQDTPDGQPGNNPGIIHETIKSSTALLTVSYRM
jgi:long-subunit fatty acid transport protein